MVLERFSDGQTGVWSGMNEVFFFGSGQGCEVKMKLLYWFWCILVCSGLFLDADLPSGCLVLGLVGYTFFCKQAGT
jgi:hypothetical protein